MADAADKHGSVLKVSGPVVVGKNMSGAAWRSARRVPRPLALIPRPRAQVPPCMSWCASASRS